MPSIENDIKNVELQLSSLNLQLCKKVEDSNDKSSPKPQPQNISDTIDLGRYVLRFRDELLKKKIMNLLKWTKAKIRLTQELINRSKIVMNHRVNYDSSSSTDSEDDSCSSLSDSDESEFPENIDEITTKLTKYKSDLKHTLKSVRKGKKKMHENKLKRTKKVDEINLENCTALDK